MTPAQTRTKFGLAEDYSHFRREVPCTSINCYTGGLRHLLARDGEAISESHIWALGEGFALDAIFDEYDEPLIRIDMFDTVDRFCATIGTELVHVAAETDRLAEQIAELTSTSSGMIAWTNTKYLGYSDLYYANRGYLHSVVVEGLGRDQGTIRLTDVLIVTLPPRACEVDVRLEDLHSGMMTAPAPKPLAKHTRAFVRMRGRPGLTADAALHFKTSLLAGCERNLALHQKASPILKYAADCERYMRQVEGDSLRAFLHRMSGNVTSLSVLPNRNLAVQALTEAMMPGELDAAVKGAAADMLLSWKTLSNLCLKASHTLSPNDLGRFRRCFENLERDEVRFWRIARDTLAEQ